MMRMMKMMKKKEKKGKDGDDKDKDDDKGEDEKEAEMFFISISYLIDLFLFSSSGVSLFVVFILVLFTIHHGFYAHSFESIIRSKKYAFFINQAHRTVNDANEDMHFYFYLPYQVSSELSLS